MSCQSCIDEAKEKNRELTNLKEIAKIKAIEDKKPKAICYDQANGYFISEVQLAFEQRFQIITIISGL
jgi:hypothetical protein